MKPAKQMGLLGKLPDAPQPMADMAGRRKPIRRIRKVQAKPAIDARAMERVKSVL